MPREKLQTASEELRKAAESATDSDLQERLHEQSDQFAQLATADRGPDQGRLARHLNALSEIRDAASEEVASHVDDAEEAITAYRETVGGV
ncbi:hypothetical protein B4589_009695 [Halolamina sp. CBA1230]|uniref:DUF7553 family protein n=1 Tax=Halolamina sp. CBA1230 TaxID=1853690 RepID=UPI0009A1B83C|nr:hypothetical protein [Halolamina sp. CBA1230]QKY20637.1 hypothetical protein B4589_009695 [Halolamina sp. CBA1230]